MADEWPHEFTEENEHAWQHVTEICDRDAREAKFHLLAHVAIVFFLQQYYQIAPSDLTENSRTKFLICFFFVGGLGAALTFALAHYRGRAIRFLLSGSTTGKELMLFFAQSTKVSFLVGFGFAVSVVAIVSGIVFALFVGIEFANTDAPLKKVVPENA